MEISDIAEWLNKGLPVVSAAFKFSISFEQITSLSSFSQLVEVVTLEVQLRNVCSMYLLSNTYYKSIILDI